jgi:hypothetical protein
MRESVLQAGSLTEEARKGLEQLDAEALGYLSDNNEEDELDNLNVIPGLPRPAWFSTKPMTISEVNLVGLSARRKQ